MYQKSEKYLLAAGQGSAWRRSQVNIYLYIFGVMSVTRIRRLARVFLRTISAVMDVVVDAGGGKIDMGGKWVGP